MGDGPPPDANYGNGWLSNSPVWSLFEPESVVAVAPSVALSTPKRRRLFGSQNELVPVFPPCDEDNYDMLNNGNAETITEDSPSNAPTATATPLTTSFPNTPIFIKYDYIARCNVFPFSIPDEAKQLIISSVQSPCPFQVFAIYCMVFLCSQVVYLIRKTGEGSYTVLVDDTSVTALTAAVEDLVVCGADGTGVDFFLVSNLFVNPSFSRFGVLVTVYVSPCVFLRPLTF